MSQIASPRAPTLIEHDGLRFLIIDSPSETTLPEVIKTLQKHHVLHLVRVCEECIYPDEMLAKNGIQSHEWPFPDGDPPPPKVIESWLKLITDVFASKPAEETIAVHCVAGLGRAPVLVAIALIERGMHPLDAVRYIRDRRRGAINRQQLAFLEKYKPQKECVLL
eukprot:EC713954.1.p1 GENE.EC713954.1~~EC713954.1.p1  ORF type:complete len:165 (+),score=15.85 EC713954.1:20-514(+)